MQNKATIIILSLIVIALALYILFYKKKSVCQNIGVEITKTDYVNKTLTYHMNVGHDFATGGIWDSTEKERTAKQGDYTFVVGALQPDNTATFKIVQGNINVMGAIVDFTKQSIETF